MLTKTRNYYKPFDYPWAFEYYQKQQQMHWLPSEVQLSSDIRDYNTKLNDDQRRLVNAILRFFTQADVDVCSGYAEHYLPTFKPPEIRMMLSAFASMEAVHQEAYSLLNETLGLLDDEYKMFMEYKEMLDKHEYLLNCDTSSPFNVAKTLAIFSAFTEGVSLFASFAILLSFPRENLLNGMGQIVTWSIRDESLHVEGMSRLFREYIKENPKVWDDQLKYEIYTAAENVVQMEDKFIDLCFNELHLPFISPYDVKGYIRYIANHRLSGIGLKYIFDVINNPLPWIDEMLSVEHVNFFENRSTSYSKGTSSGSWSDVFK